MKNQGIFLLLKIIHIGATTLLFYIFWMLFRLKYSASVDHRYDYLVTLGYIVILYFLNRTYNAYLLGFTRIRTLVLSQFIAQAFSILLIYLAVSIGWAQFKSSHYFFPMLELQGIFDCIWSFLANKLYYKLNPPKRTIFIYKSEIDKIRFGSIEGKSVGFIYKIDKELKDCGSNFHDIQEEVKDFEAIFVSGVSSRCRNGILKYCVEKSIPGFFLPHIGDVLMRGASHIQTFTSPVMYFGRKKLEPEYLVAKRAFDFCTSIIGLLLLSPLMILLAVVIKAYDKGPVFYKQVRLTKDGKEFEIYKFRSMCVDAEAEGGAKLSTGENDHRVTPVGRFLRRHRLDEIPQLLNVLKGEMSMVGPRPERPEIAKMYYDTIPEFRLRLQVKAGLTGYAQIYGKYNIQPYEKLEFDLLYINDMSFLTDLRLIFATFSILGNVK